MQRDVVRFEKGSILRKEMLESMYNFPRFLCEGYYSSYGDGVLYGLEWGISDGKHFITPGALKYKGEIYFQTDTLILEDVIESFSLESGQEYYIYFKESTPIHTAAQDFYELVISFEKEPIENGFCIKYVKYELNKIKDSEKKIFGLYAMPDSSAWGIPPWVVKDKTYSILLEKKTKHHLDYEILKCIYDNRPLSTSFIELYISEYNNTVNKDAKITIDSEMTDKSIKELVDGFCKAVQKLELPICFNQFYSSTGAIEEKVSKENNKHGGLL